MICRHGIFIVFPPLPLAGIMFRSARPAERNSRITVLSRVLFPPVKPGEIHACLALSGRSGTTWRVSPTMRCDDDA